MILKYNIYRREKGLHHLILLIDEIMYAINSYLPFLQS